MAEGQGLGKARPTRRCTGRLTPPVSFQPLCAPGTVVAEVRFRQKGVDAPRRANLLSSLVAERLRQPTYTGERDNGTIG